MINDPIVDELDRLRAERMAKFNFDFEAFYRDLKEQEKLLPQAVQPPPETSTEPTRRSGLYALVICHGRAMMRCRGGPIGSSSPWKGEI